MRTGLRFSRRRTAAHYQQIMCPALHSPTVLVSELDGILLKTRFRCGYGKRNGNPFGTLPDVELFLRDVSRLCRGVNNAGIREKVVSGISKLISQSRGTDLPRTLGVTVERRSVVGRTNAITLSNHPRKSRYGLSRSDELHIFPTTLDLRCNATYIYEKKEARI